MTVFVCIMLQGFSLNMAADFVAPFTLSASVQFLLELKDAYICSVLIIYRHMDI
jgi:hypothetical protein